MRRGGYLRRPDFSEVNPARSKPPPADGILNCPCCHGDKGGDLLYRWGNPPARCAGAFADQQLFWQHNPYWIPEGLPGAGNILIVNNGDEFGGRYLDCSSVVEIMPPTTP